MLDVLLPPATQARYWDQVALLSIALRRGTCEATGAPLRYRETVVTTVEESPGVHRAVAVTAAHWDSGQGLLSSADPRADKDILDGRLLFPCDAPAGNVPGYAHVLAGGVR